MPHTSTTELGEPGVHDSNFRNLAHTWQIFWPAASAGKEACHALPSLAGCSARHLEENKAVQVGCVNPMHYMAWHGMAWPCAVQANTRSGQEVCP
jgi:hypothetical protein